MTNSEVVEAEAALAEKRPTPLHPIIKASARFLVFNRADLPFRLRHRLPYTTSRHAIGLRSLVR